MAQSHALTSWLRQSILFLGIAGTLFFGVVFTLSYTTPGFVEQVAKELIRLQVTSQVNQKIDALSDSALIEHALVLTRQHDNRIAELQEQLRQGLPERIASIIAKMDDLDCECRNITAQHIRSAVEGSLFSLTQAREKLKAFICTKYIEVNAQLLREFRIFTGTHAFVFLFLVAAIFLHRSYKIQLLPPAFLLFTASLINAYLYIFKQNWLNTIVFSHYVGLAYIVYMGIIFVFLCDLVFNKGRITDFLIQTVCSFISSIFSSPC